MRQYKIEFDSMPWDSPMAGVRCKAFRQGGRQLRLVEYTPEMPPHWCEKGHVGCILEGRFEIKFDEEVVIFEQGDGVFIPSGKEHRHMGRALSDIVRVVFVEDVG